MSPESNFTHIRPVADTLIYVDKRTDRRTDEQPDNSFEESAFMAIYRTFSNLIRNLFTVSEG